MGRVFCAVFVVLCMFAGSSESSRFTHEHFSQGAYYDQTVNETEKPVRVVTETPEGKVGEETPVTTTSNPAPAGETNGVIPDRYPHGYPGQEQYNQQMNGEDPEAAFSGYKNKNVQFSSSVDTKENEVVPDRYPHGYPGSENPVFDPQPENPEQKFEQGNYVSFSSNPSTNENTEGVIPNRYPHGYYNDAEDEAKTQGEADVYTSFHGANYNQFSSDNIVGDEKTTTPERYPHGYYPGLNTNAPADTQLTSQQNQVSFQQYSSQPNNQPRFGYEGIQGDFSTQYEIPFELTGAGCPSQYWVSHTQKWPKFFNIKSTIGDAFGGKATAVFGQTTLLQALMDPRTDPYSTLLSEGATAILNSYSRAQYSYKSPKVIEFFNTALATREAASKQAADFNKANEASMTSFTAGIGGSCS